MRGKLLILAQVCFLVGGLALVGCKKSNEPAAVDPHSPKGIMKVLQQQGRLLNDALARQDFKYIHDYAYYFTGLTQALYSALDEENRQKFKAPLEELVKIGNALDHSAGRRHAEATTASMERLQVVLKELDKEFQTIKQGS
jgi:hypothetical protein